MCIRRAHSRRGGRDDSGERGAAAERNRRNHRFAVDVALVASHLHNYPAGSCDRSEHDEGESRPRLAIGTQVVRRMHGKLLQNPPSPALDNREYARFRSSGARHHACWRRRSLALLMRASICASRHAVSVVSGMRCLSRCIDFARQNPRPILLISNNHATSLFCGEGLNLPAGVSPYRQSGRIPARIAGCCARAPPLHGKRDRQREPQHALGFAEN